LLEVLVQDLVPLYFLLLPALASNFAVHSFADEVDFGVEKALLHIFGLPLLLFPLQSFEPFSRPLLSEVDDIFFAQFVTDELADSIDTRLVLVVGLCD